MYKNYLSVVKDSIKENQFQWKFKSNDEYRKILEHVTKEQGEQYLIEIKKFFEKNNDSKTIDLLMFELKKTSTYNDMYGRPIKEEIKEFSYTSPTNLRYIFHSLLILKHIATNELDKKGINIVEIGGGYGGLCYFIIRLSKLFNVNIKSYTIFDIDSVCRLQALYLKSLNVNSISFNPKSLRDNSFLISNYAFSEISLEKRQRYILNVIKPYISNGFLVWNFIPFYRFISKPFEIEKEYPETGKGNLYVKF